MIFSSASLCVFFSVCDLRLCVSDSLLFFKEGKFKTANKQQKREHPDDFCDI
jgi:hypothetical protein